jgi:hypothetical protein
MSSFLVDYPFASRLYPGALDAIRRLRVLITIERFGCLVNVDSATLLDKDAVGHA